YENVVERYRYDAYGNPYEGRFLHMPKNNPYGFTGQRFEPELRMYTFAYRTYNPMSMRWMTVDPVRDGTNWYLYVSGDPVNFWDPLGLEEYNLIIFYYNTETDPDESFRRAAITNARETEAKDYFLSVTTETDFKEGWTRTKEIFERRGDEVANISIFTHGGIGRLYFVPDSKNDGTLTYSEIEKLPQLPYKDDAEITIHACNSGVGQYSTAQAFANSQQIPAYGTQTYTNFSEKYEVFDRIDRNSENVYLEAYDKNFIFGGELIPKVKFYPEVNNDDLCD
ncbi:MAG: RHS repeat-associated core domain-containing protein, partial [Halanaerobiales bacterium]